MLICRWGQLRLGVIYLFLWELRKMGNSRAGTISLVLFPLSIPSNISAQFDPRS